MNNYSDYLEHHGILGQKWGVRRYQNKDGTLTAAGKKHLDETNPTVTIVNEDTKNYQKKEKFELTKSQKVLLGIGGLAVGSAVVVAAAKYGEYSFDKVLDTGKTLQRIGNDVQLGEHFFASYGKHDNARYEGLLGKWRYDQGWNPEKLTLKTNDKIKVASDKNAKKEFKRLVKEGQIFGYDKKDYDRFNRTLVDDSLSSKKFYKALEDKGYNAIRDQNDRKKSGYNTKNPLIFFGDANKKIDIVSRSEIENMDRKYANELRKALLESSRKEFIKQYGTPAIPISLGAYTTAFVSTGKKKDTKTKDSV